MNSIRAILLSVTILPVGAAVVAAPAERARLAEAFAPDSAAWTLLSGDVRRPVGANAGSGATREINFSSLRPADPAQWRIADGRVWVGSGGAGRFAVAAYTVQVGGAGFYALADSALRREVTPAGRIDLRVWVHRSGRPDDRQAEPAVATSLAGGEVFDFDAFLGYLDAGDRLLVGIGSGEGPARAPSEIDFTVVRTPFIPVSVFPEDIANPRTVEAPGGWSLAGGVAAGSAQARQLAWGRNERHGFNLGSDRVRLTSATMGAAATAQESVAMFRVPHSGYYALHEAWQSATGGRVEARLYVGRESAARRMVVAEPGAGHVSLNLDIGYVEQGDVIALAFATVSGTAATAVEFGGSIVEWAPRRPPLRVRRGTDGLLDVYEPDAPRHAVDIPPARWVSVPAAAGDATEAIRRALAQAQAAQSGNDYAGIRLEAGKTYVVASTQTGGSLLPVRDARRIVFDGNGATLVVSSPELPRREVTLFSASGSREIVFADFTVRATSVPFTTGEVLAVSPPNSTTQTVTFRVTPGAPDPLRDISRSGQSDAYAYDPLIPGRIAIGTWTHYPGRGDPPLQATGQPGVFTHRVTRTGNSISVGDKWLVKNKRGGVIYLATRGGAENITLSGVTGRASGGGHLRFSPASGINILNCRFEPDGGNWISSSADSVHGRGREGVWIENTLIRGICEDVMNTYGQSMVVLADDDAGDAILSLRMFDSGSESTSRPTLRMPSAENVLPGDQLVFFNPKSGRVLGYAGVRAFANGRVTLSNPIAGIDPWEAGDGKSATMVYNTRVAARFFVRDSRVMDSMRFGIYIKARGGVIFNSQFEGLSGPSILATNEPEWPEGPPATHLWVQGCVFSQNNYGYMPRHRAFMVVDPADISIYTRRLRDPSEPEGFRAHLTHGEYANNHMKLIGNVFHDWRGLGIAVRNSRNVLIRDNLFLPPADDAVIRQTLAKDPALTRDGRGIFAAILLGSVNGGRVAGNRAYGLSGGDQTVVRESDANGVAESDNEAPSLRGAGPDVALSFGEWFGASSVEAAAVGSVRDRVALRGAAHRAGRLGAGLFFDGNDDLAVLAASSDAGNRSFAQLSVAMWIQPDRRTKRTEVIHSQGDRQHGLVVAIDQERLVAGLWQGNDGAWLDLGAVTPGLWRHVALVFDGDAGTLRGFVDGLGVAACDRDLPAKLEALGNDAAFAGVLAAIRLDRQRLVAAGAAAYRGGLDEYRRFSRAIDAGEVALLALRRPAAGASNK